MRVVHLCGLALSAAHPDFGKRFGHPGTWSLQLAKAQRSHTSIEPLLVVPAPNTSRDFHTEIDGISVDFVKLPARFRATTLFFEDRRLLKKQVLRHKPDLVHAHGTEESYGLTAQDTRLPYVITAQGVINVINRQVPRPLISRYRLIAFLERQCFKRAEHVIVKSEYAQRKLQTLFPHLTLHLIPNTFDQKILAINRPKAVHRAAFLGTMRPGKGLHVVAQALPKIVSALPDFELHLIGNPADTPYLRQVLQSFREHLGQRLVCHGLLPQIKAWEIVATANALIAPSLAEMFGNQVIEALLLGTWPIVSDQTAMAENVARFRAGTVFAKGNSDALATAVIQGFRDAAGWKHADTVAAIRAWMEPKTVARQHEELYRMIAKPASVP